MPFNVSEGHQDSIPSTLTFIQYKSDYYISAGNVLDSYDRLQVHAIQNLRRKMRRRNELLYDVRHIMACIRVQARLLFNSRLAEYNKTKLEGKQSQKNLELSEEDVDISVE